MNDAPEEVDAVVEFIREHGFFVYHGLVSGSSDWRICVNKILREHSGENRKAYVADVFVRSDGSFNVETVAEPSEPHNNMDIVVMFEGYLYEPGSLDKIKDILDECALQKGL